MPRKSKHQQRVELFMLLAGQDVPAKPCLLTPEVRVLRAKLIFSEAVQELIALGLRVSIHAGNQDQSTVSLFDSDTKFTFTAMEGDMDIIEFVDGCHDTAVVTTGSLSAAGIADEPGQKATDENNLAKFGPGGYRSDGTDGNPKGKWIKPAGHKPPDFVKVLKRQGYKFPKVKKTKV